MPYHWLCCRTSGSSSATSQLRLKEYNFNHDRRGVCLIINNKTFRASTGQSDRVGSDVDADNIYSTFAQLGFETRRYDDLTATDLSLTMRKGNHDILLPSRQTWDIERQCWFNVGRPSQTVTQRWTKICSMCPVYWCGYIQWNNTKYILNLITLKYVCINHVFFQFQIILNVLVSSFCCDFIR